MGGRKVSVNTAYLLAIHARANIEIGGSIAYGPVRNLGEVGQWGGGYLPVWTPARTFATRMLKWRCSAVPPTYNEKNASELSLLAFHQPEPRMTEADIEVEVDDGTYEPYPEHVHEGSVLLADPVEFFEVFNGYGAMMWEGSLLVLNKDSLQWVNVVPDTKAKAKSGLSSVK